MTNKIDDIAVGVKVNTEGLDDFIDDMEEVSSLVSDTRPNITIRNNQSVCVTFNFFNKEDNNG